MSGSGRRGRETSLRCALSLTLRPFLPDPTPDQPDRMRATYCLVLLDDYSRRVVAGQFAWSADTALLESLLWTAIQRWGTPRKLYTDLCRSRNYPDRLSSR